MKKIINSADKQYVPVDTENLVLDDTPTEGSFNAVTSDGVAKAIAGGGGGGGTEYYAGDGIDITADTISVKIDSDTIVLNGDGELVANVSGGKSCVAGDGITITEGAESNRISAKVDGSTIQVNASGELEAVGGGGSSYTSGDGIAIVNNKIKVDLVSDKGLEFVSSTETSFTADYTGYDLGQWGYMGIGPLHKTSDNAYFQLDFRHTSENYLAWNLANGTEYYIFAYDPQDSTKYATCGEPYYADIDQATVVGIGYAWGDGQYEHLYSADPANWYFFGGFDETDFDSAAFGIYFPNSVGTSPMGTDFAAIGQSLLPNIGYTTTTIVHDTGKLQVKVNEYSGIKVDGSGVAVKVDNSTIQVNANGELVAAGGTQDGLVRSYDWSTVTYYDIESTLINGNTPVILYDRFSDNNVVRGYLNKVDHDNGAYIFTTPVSQASLDTTQQSYTVTTFTLTSADGKFVSYADKVAARITTDSTLSLTQPNPGVPTLQLSVATPIPAFDPSTDVGKVLQVTANGLAWVNP